jgi:hypothetical protein
MHTNDLVDEDCQWTHAKLGAYVRKGLSRRDAQKVDTHLDGCRRCTAMYLELDEVNSSLAALLGPLVLGAAATSYLTATGAGGAAATGLLALLDRGKDFVLANGQAAAAVGAVAGVAGVATVAVVLAGSGANHPTASPPRPSVTAPLSPPTTAVPTPQKSPKAHHRKAPSAPRTTAPVAPVALTTAPANVTKPQAKPQTKPQTKPKTTKPAAPNPTTTKTPTVRRADLSVRLTFSLRVGVLTADRDGLLGYLTANVAGIPAGQRTTVTVRVVGGRLVQRGSACKPAGSVATCSVGPDSAPLEFNVMGVPVSATATVTVPAGYSDPATTNNTDSVLLGALRLGSLRG